MQTVFTLLKYVPFVGAIPGSLQILDALSEKNRRIHRIAQRCLYPDTPPHAIRDGILYCLPFVNTGFGLIRLFKKVLYKSSQLIFRHPEALKGDQDIQKMRDIAFDTALSFLSEEELGEEKWKGKEGKLKRCCQFLTSERECVALIKVVRTRAGNKMALLSELINSINLESSDYARIALYHLASLLEEQNIRLLRQADSYCKMIRTEEDYQAFLCITRSFRLDELYGFIVNQSQILAPELERLLQFENHYLSTVVRTYVTLCGFNSPLSHKDRQAMEGFIRLCKGLPAEQMIQIIKFRDCLEYTDLCRNRVILSIAVHLIRTNQLNEQMTADIHSFAKGLLYDNSHFWDEAISLTTCACIPNLSQKCLLEFMEHTRSIACRDAKQFALQLAAYLPRTVPYLVQDVLEFADKVSKFFRETPEELKKRGRELFLSSHLYSFLGELQVDINERLDDIAVASVYQKLMGFIKDVRPDLRHSFFLALRRLKDSPGLFPFMTRATFTYMVFSEAPLHCGQEFLEDHVDRIEGWSQLPVEERRSVPFHFISSLDDERKRMIPLLETYLGDGSTVFSNNLALLIASVREPLEGFSYTYLEEEAEDLWGNNIRTLMQDKWFPLIRNGWKRLAFIHVVNLVAWISLEKALALCDGIETKKQLESFVHGLKKIPKPYRTLNVVSWIASRSKTYGLQEALDLYVALFTRSGTQEEKRELVELLEYENEREKIIEFILRFSSLIPLSNLIKILGVFCAHREAMRFMLDLVRPAHVIFVTQQLSLLLEKYDAKNVEENFLRGMCAICEASTGLSGHAEEGFFSLIALLPIEERVEVAQSAIFRNLCCQMTEKNHVLACESSFKKIPEKSRKQVLTSVHFVCNELKEKEAYLSIFILQCCDCEAATVRQRGGGWVQWIVSWSGIYPMESVLRNYVSLLAGRSEEEEESILVTLSRFSQGVEREEAAAALLHAQQLGLLRSNKTEDLQEFFAGITSRVQIFILKDRLNRARTKEEGARSLNDLRVICRASEGLTGFAEKGFLLLTSLLPQEEQEGAIKYPSLRDFCQRMEDENHLFSCLQALFFGVPREKRNEFLMETTSLYCSHENIHHGFSSFVLRAWLFSSGMEVNIEDIAKRIGNSRALSAFNHIWMRMGSRVNIAPSIEKWQQTCHTEADLLSVSEMTALGRNYFADPAWMREGFVPKMAALLQTVGECQKIEAALFSTSRMVSMIDQASEENVLAICLDIETEAEVEPYLLALRKIPPSRKEQVISWVVSRSKAYSALEALNVYASLFDDTYSYDQGRIIESLGYIPSGREDVARMIIDCSLYGIEKREIAEVLQKRFTSPYRLVTEVTYSRNIVGLFQFVRADSRWDSWPISILSESEEELGYLLAICRASEGMKRYAQKGFKLLIESLPFEEQETAMTGAELRYFCSRMRTEEDVDACEIVLERVPKSSFRQFLDTTIPLCNDYKNATQGLALFILRAHLSAANISTDVHALARQINDLKTLRCLNFSLRGIPSDRVVPSSEKMGNMLGHAIRGFYSFVRAAYDRGEAMGWVEKSSEHLLAIYRDLTTQAQIEFNNNLLNVSEEYRNHIIDWIVSRSEAYTIEESLKLYVGLLKDMYLSQGYVVYLIEFIGMFFERIPTQEKEKYYTALVRLMAGGSSDQEQQKILSLIRPDIQNVEELKKCIGDLWVLKEFRSGIIKWVRSRPETYRCGDALSLFFVLLDGLTPKDKIRIIKLLDRFPDSARLEAVKVVRGCSFDLRMRFLEQQLSDESEDREIALLNRLQAINRKVEGMAPYVKNEVIELILCHPVREQERAVEGEEVQSGIMFFRSLEGFIGKLNTDKEKAAFLGFMRRVLPENREGMFWYTQLIERRIEEGKVASHIKFSLVIRMLSSFAPAHVNKTSVENVFAVCEKLGDEKQAELFLQSLEKIPASFKNSVIRWVVLRPKESSVRALLNIYVFLFANRSEEERRILVKIFDSLHPDREADIEHLLYFIEQLSFITEEGEYYLNRLLAVLKAPQDLHGYARMGLAALAVSLPDVELEKLIGRAAICHQMNCVAHVRICQSTFEELPVDKRWQFLMDASSLSSSQGSNESLTQLVLRARFDPSALSSDIDGIATHIGDSKTLFLLNELLKRDKSRRFFEQLKDFCQLKPTLVSNLLEVLYLVPVPSFDTVIEVMKGGTPAFTLFSDSTLREATIKDWTERFIRGFTGLQEAKQFVDIVLHSQQLGFSVVFPSYLLDIISYDSIFESDQADVNPYIIRGRLKHMSRIPVSSVETPPQVVGGREVRVNPVKFQERSQKRAVLVYKDFPSDISPHELDLLFSALEKRIDELDAETRQSTHVLINVETGTTLEGLKELFFQYSYIKKLMSHPRGDDHEKVPKMVARLHAILRFVKNQSSKIGDKELLSPQESLLLKYAASISACSIAKKDGITLVYNGLPVEYRVESEPVEMPDREKATNYLDRAVQEILFSFLSADNSFLASLVGVPQNSIRQLTHQALYVKNSIASSVGLHHSTQFDFHTSALYRVLTGRGRKEMLAQFYSHFLPAFLVRSLEMKVSADGRKGLYDMLSFLLPSDRLAEFWSTDDETYTFSLNEKGACELLLQVGYLKEEKKTVA